MPDLKEGEYRALPLSRLVLTYVVVAIPFIFSGVAVTLALTRFPSQIGRLYAADLAGAALGCVLLILVLDVTDGPSAVVVVAGLAALGGLLFSLDLPGWRSRLPALLVFLAFAGTSVWFTILVRRQDPAIRLTYVKGRKEPEYLYEKWNSFSRIDVSGHPDWDTPPQGWGLSPAVPPDMVCRVLWLRIDAGAATMLVRYDGKPEQIEFLKYDITNLAYWFRSNARVAVVGSGGGRDVQAALAFNQKSIVAVEMNENTIEAANERFGDFTGHLDRNPRIQYVHDEARSYLSRAREPFDIIQIALVDTWAATVAGAFVLAENSLYTTEAWQTFLERLTPGGVLTFSRWYLKGRPGEAYRLVSLASDALLRTGVEDPRAHILMAKVLSADPQGGPDGVCTILVGREPFSPEDVRVFNEVCERMRFEPILTPEFAEDETFAALGSGKDLDAFTARFPIDISPPTDDSL